MLGCVKMHALFCFSRKHVQKDTVKTLACIVEIHHDITSILKVG